MSWVRLSDNFYRHPKFLRAGPRGGYLAICGIAYANEYLTDGFIPEIALGALGATTRDIGAVVDSGLWTPADGGWAIHDFADYQASRAQVEAERKAARERMRRVRANGKRT